MESQAQNDKGICETITYTEAELHAVLCGILEAMQGINQTLRIILEMMSDQEVGEA